MTLILANKKVLFFKLIFGLSVFLKSFFGAHRAQHLICIQRIFFFTLSMDKQLNSGALYTPGDKNTKPVSTFKFVSKSNFFLKKFDKIDQRVWKKDT